MKRKFPLLILLVLVGCSDAGTSSDIVQPLAIGSELSELIRDAEQGIADAQYDLAIEYFNGDQIAQDYDVAKSLYLKAAEQGHRDAQYNLGVMFLTGDGANKNLDEAIRWLEMAANNLELGSAIQGDPDAQYILGMLYYDGEEVAEDMELARYWLEKSSFNGNDDAKILLDELEDTTSTLSASSDGSWNFLVGKCKVGGEVQITECSLAALQNFRLTTQLTKFETTTMDLIVVADNPQMSRSLRKELTFDDVPVTYKPTPDGLGVSIAFLNQDGSCLTTNYYFLREGRYFEENGPLDSNCGEYEKIVYARLQSFGAREVRLLDFSE